MNPNDFKLFNGQPGDVSVKVAGVVTWYAVPFRRLTEFKHAIRAQHNGARLSGRHPHYEVIL